MKHSFGQHCLAGDQRRVHVSGKAYSPVMIRITPIQKRNYRAGIRNSGHYSLANPLRRERSSGPSMLPATRRNGFSFSDRRTLSNTSFTRLPRDRPVARACSSTHAAKSSLNRTLSVVLIRRTCQTLPRFVNYANDKATSPPAAEAARKQIPMRANSREVLGSLDRGCAGLGPQERQRRLKCGHARLTRARLVGPRRSNSACTLTSSSVPTT